MAFRTMTCQTACHRTVVLTRMTGGTSNACCPAENVRLPEGMRPVAETLAALRAAPMRAELADEASARAAFREIMLAGGSGPARPGGGADGARTLILPARARGAGPHAVTRPRHAHRRPRRRGRWQPKALAGAAAAAVIVGGIALAGIFSGAGGHPGQLGRSSGATSATPESSHSRSNGLEGTATKEPTPHPTPSQSTAGGSGAESEAKALCSQYLGFIMHHESRSDWAAEGDTYDQLSNLAGGSWHIVGYCVDLDIRGRCPRRGPGLTTRGPGCRRRAIRSLAPRRVPRGEPAQGPAGRERPGRKRRERR